MHLGCIVLATDVGCQVGIIEDKKTGFLLPINKPNEWAEKIARINSDDFQETNFDNWLLLTSETDNEDT